MTSQECAAATNYAKILLQIYCPCCRDAEQEQKNPLHYTILKALKEVDQLLKDKRNYYILFSLSRLPREKSNRVLESLADELVFDKSFLLFLKFIVHNKRVQLFPSIALIAKKMIYEKLGMEECRVFASHEVEGGQLGILQKKFSQKLGKKLEINFEIKKDLVLGLRVVTEKYIWESSFSQKLQNLNLVPS